MVVQTDQVPRQLAVGRRSARDVLGPGIEYKNAYSLTSVNWASHCSTWPMFSFLLNLTTCSHDEADTMSVLLAAGSLHCPHSAQALLSCFRCKLRWSVPTDSTAHTSSTRGSEDEHTKTRTWESTGFPKQEELAF